ncbi:tyrosine-type recombinase/integrase [Methylobacter sp. sgz302048]|uniref:tyrosine-type recombinase/integrase n=1 Tax=Methylobacter sp. sgz302048 TaxID=3455945 RepID=UPI003FA0AF36
MITKRPNSQYFYSEFVLNGKRFVKSTKTKNRTLAAKIDRQYYDEAVEQSKLGGKSISLKDALELFKQSKRDNEKYQREIGFVVDWINQNMNSSLPMSKIDNAFLHSFVEKRFARGLKPATVKKNLLILTGTIKLMRKLGYDICQVESPTIKVKNVKTRVLTKEEEERLLKELRPDENFRGGPSHRKNRETLYVFTVVLIDTACRWCEIANLKWEQINFEKRTITVWRSKTSTAGVLPMSKRVYELLVNRGKTSEWVFPNKTGEAPRGYSSTAWKKACERAGIDGVTFHTTRHSQLTRLTQAGLSLAQIKAISGHADLQSLQRYQHLTTHDVMDKVRDILDS